MGYQFGGTSPFGAHAPGLQVYAEFTIFDLPEVLVNGGKRDNKATLAPSAFVNVLNAQAVNVAVPV